MAAIHAALVLGQVFGELRHGGSSAAIFMAPVKKTCIEAAPG